MRKFNLFQTSFLVVLPRNEGTTSILYLARLNFILNKNLRALALKLVKPAKGMYKNFTSEGPNHPNKL